MDFVAEINALITLAADLPKDGVATTPFRNGLARVKKALLKELETLNTRLSEMEADSKDTILAKENDGLTARLHEAGEEIERLKYDLAKIKKKEAEKTKKEQEADHLSLAERRILWHIDRQGQAEETTIDHLVAERAAFPLLDGLREGGFLKLLTDSRHGTLSIYVLTKKAKAWIAENTEPPPPVVEVPF